MQIYSHSDICNIHDYKSKLFDRLIDISYQEQLAVPKYFFLALDDIHRSFWFLCVHTLTLQQYKASHVHASTYLQSDFMLEIQL